MADQKTERTMAGKSGAKGGAGGGAGGKGGEEEAAGGGRKKLVVVAALGAVLLLGGGGAGSYFLFAKPASASTEKAEEEVLTPGTVTALDPITINLSDGNYLKLGIALQGVEAASGGHGESSDTLDGSKALDLAIGEFSGLSMADLSNADNRTKYKDELQKKIVEAYTTQPAADEKDAHPTKTVMGIYLTQFVMQ